MPFFSETLRSEDLCIKQIIYIYTIKVFVRVPIHISGSYQKHFVISIDVLFEKDHDRSKHLKLFGSSLIQNSQISELTFCQFLNSIHTMDFVILKVREEIFVFLSSSEKTNICVRGAFMQ